MTQESGEHGSLMSIIDFVGILPKTRNSKVEIDFTFLVGHSWENATDAAKGCEGSLCGETDLYFHILRRQ